MQKTHHGLSVESFCPRSRRSTFNCTLVCGDFPNTYSCFPTSREEAIPNSEILLSFPLSTYLFCSHPKYMRFKPQYNNRTQMLSNHRDAPSKETPISLNRGFPTWHRVSSRVHQYLLSRFWWVIRGVIFIPTLPGRSKHCCGPASPLH